MLGGGKLATLEAFEEYMGRSLDTVPLRVLPTYNFVCYLTNLSGESELHRESEDDDNDE